MPLRSFLFLRIKENIAGGTEVEVHLEDRFQDFIIEIAAILHMALEQTS
jgi:hypothetical protein